MARPYPATDRKQKPPFQALAFNLWGIREYQFDAAQHPFGFLNGQTAGAADIQHPFVLSQPKRRLLVQRQLGREKPRDSRPGLAI